MSCADCTHSRIGSNGVRLGVQCNLRTGAARLEFVREACERFKRAHCPQCRNGINAMTKKPCAMCGGSGWQ